MLTNRRTFASPNIEPSDADLKFAMNDLAKNAVARQAIAQDHLMSMIKINPATSGIRLKRKP